MYSVQSIFVVILIMCLDCKGCALAMLGLPQFTSELPNSSFWIYNLHVYDHNLQEQAACSWSRWPTNSTLRVVTAHHLMLYYNQMLSNLKGRCQGEGAAEAPGGAGAGAQQLLLAPAALRTQPSQGQCWSTYHPNSVSHRLLNFFTGTLYVCDLAHCP